MVRCRPLGEETSAAGCRGAALRLALTGEESAANAALYVLLRAVDRFHQTYQRFPGVYDRWGPPEEGRARNRACLCGDTCGRGMGWRPLAAQGLDWCSLAAPRLCCMPTTIAVRAPAKVARVCLIMV